MSDTHPGVEDEVEHALRLGLATAAQLADRVARARQELARDAQRRSDDEHRQLEARFSAEGASAAARLSVVERPEWWNHATPQQILSLYELACQWRDDQPLAATAADTIAQQVQHRYGIDVTTPAANPDELGAALARIDVQRATANSPATAGERPDDLASGVVAVVRVDPRDLALGVAGGTTAGGNNVAGTPPVQSRAVHEPIESASPYDTHTRRDLSAAHMREFGLSEETIDVAKRADIAHARPAAVAATAALSAPRATARRSADRRSHGLDRDY